MVDELGAFDLPDGRAAAFEDLGQENGHRYWWQSDLAALLGYKHNAGLEKAVGKAMAACTALGISVPENFRPVDREVDGHTIHDCKLSRFACYLTAMNGDPRKPEVAAAQAYFATFAEATRQFLLRAENVERVAIRDEVTEGQKALSHSAKMAGVVDFGLFQNAGYRGLYNMNLSEIIRRKGVPTGKTLLDFMGKEELAANLFRITQTEAKIRNEGVKGQGPLESTAFEVGRHVRRTIESIGGTPPERLPVAEDISQVKKGLKATSRDFRRLDQEQPKKRLPRTADDK